MPVLVLVANTIVMDRRHSCIHIWSSAVAADQAVANDTTDKETTIHTLVHMTCSSRDSTTQQLSVLHIVLVQVHTLIAWLLEDTRDM